MEWPRADPRNTPTVHLERQLPIFKSRGLDLGGCYLGTLNIDIRPMVFEMMRPDFTFQRRVCGQTCTRRNTSRSRNAA